MTEIGRVGEESSGGLSKIFGVLAVWAGHDGGDRQGADHAHDLEQKEKIR